MEKQAKQYPLGLYWRNKGEKVPDFVVGGIGIKKDVFINWLNKQEGEYVNLKVLKKYQSEEINVEVDTWKPTPKVKETKVDTGEVEDISKFIPF